MSISYKILFASAWLLILSLNSHFVLAQESVGVERFGKTLNTGVGLAYYGHVGHTLPVLHANYEFDVANNFTLAPFITLYSYEKESFWGNGNSPDGLYTYRVIVVPIGLKGTYYFDELIEAGSNWDFYAAGSLGIAIRNTHWEDGYFGNKSVKHGSSGVYLDLHVGCEYHVSRKVGVFLDLSTGISTFGLAIH